MAAGSRDGSALRIMKRRRLENRPVMRISLRVGLSASMCIVGYRPPVSDRRGVASYPGWKE